MHTQSFSEVCYLLFICSKSPLTKQNRPVPTQNQALNNAEESSQLELPVFAAALNPDELDSDWTVRIIRRLGSMNE